MLSGFMTENEIAVLFTMVVDPMTQGKPRRTWAETAERRNQTPREIMKVYRGVMRKLRGSLPKLAEWLGDTT